jgi:hypothetical protein
MIICDDWLTFLCWAKHILKKGEACGIVMGELNQSWIWHQGISPLTHDKAWWPILWGLSKQNIKGFHYCHKMELDDLNNKFTKIQYQMVFTLTFYEDYWLVQRNYLRNFKLSFDKGHVVIYITLDLQMEDCKSKNIWYQSKDKQFEWHLK